MRSFFVVVRWVLCTSFSVVHKRSLVLQGSILQAAFRTTEPDSQLRHSLSHRCNYMDNCFDGVERSVPTKQSELGSDCRSPFIRYSSRRSVMFIFGLEFLSVFDSSLRFLSSPPFTICCGFFEHYQGGRRVRQIPFYTASIFARSRLDQRIFCPLKMNLYFQKFSWKAVRFPTILWLSAMIMWL